MNNFQYNYFNYKPNKSEKNQLSNYPFRLIYIYIYIYMQGHSFLAGPSDERGSRPNGPSTMNMQRMGPKAGL